MRTWRVFWSAAGLATLLTACATPAPSPAAAEEPVDVQVDVQRDGADWTAAYHFALDAPVWAFVQSAPARRLQQPWRSLRWRVLTPGVVLDRTGVYDTLHMADGSAVPRQVRIALQPANDNLVAANNPALVLSSGAVALYTRQFDVIALPSLDAVRALPADLNGVAVGTRAPQLDLSDHAGPVLVQGTWQARARLRAVSAYVVFGQPTVVETPHLAALLDSGLPPWIGDTLRSFMPSMIDLYATRLGPRGPNRPTVIVAWAGATPGVTSQQGSVVPDTILVTLEGRALMTTSAPMLERMRWFIAHESAHFWLGQTVRHAGGADAWISEGGADLLAWRGLAQRVPGSGPDVAAGLRGAVDECTALSVNKPLATAGQRGEYRAFYACGLVFGLVAEAALQRSQPHADFFDFVAGLLERHRAAGVVNAADWRAELARVSGDADLVEAVRRFTEDGVPDPQAFIAALLQRAGVRL